MEGGLQRSCIQWTHERYCTGLEALKMEVREDGLGQWMRQFLTAIQAEISSADALVSFEDLVTERQSPEGKQVLIMKALAYAYQLLETRKEFQSLKSLLTRDNDLLSECLSVLNLIVTEIVTQANRDGNYANIHNSLQSGVEKFYRRIYRMLTDRESGERVPSVKSHQILAQWAESFRKIPRIPLETEDASITDQDQETIVATIQGVILKIKSKQARKVIELTLKGRTQAEIGRILHKTRAAVHSNLQKGIEELRKILGHL